MYKLTNPLPKVWKVTKEVINQFGRDAKVAKLDAALCIITLIVIIWYIFDDIYVEGAVGVLFIYSFLVVRRIAKLTNQVKELKKLINPTNLT
jgi:hypothetical protein